MRTHWSQVLACGNCGKRGHVRMTRVELLRWYTFTVETVMVFANGATLRVPAGDYYPILYGSAMTRVPKQIIGRQP